MDVRQGREGGGGGGVRLDVRGVIIRGNIINIIINRLTEEVFVPPHIQKHTQCLLCLIASYLTRLHDNIYIYYSAIMIHNTSEQRLPPQLPGTRGRANAADSI